MPKRFLLRSARAHRPRSGSPLQLIPQYSAPMPLRVRQPLRLPDKTFTGTCSGALQRGIFSSVGAHLRVRPLGLRAHLSDRLTFPAPANEPYPGVTDRTKET